MTLTNYIAVVQTAGKWKDRKGKEASYLGKRGQVLCSKNHPVASLWGGGTMYSMQTKRFNFEEEKKKLSPTL